MKVKDIMTTDVQVIRPDSLISEAANHMRSLNIGSLPVCDGQRLVGMITDRDITVRAVAEGRDLQNTRVRDCMTSQIAYCFEDDNVQEAEHLMEEKQIRRLPVLTREKKLSGIVALGDLATGTGDLQQVGRTIREISEPQRSL